jgi:Skp family chaperone for outer membrane proteins
MNKLGDAPVKRVWTAAPLLWGCLMVAGPAWSASAHGCGVFSTDRLVMQSQRVRQSQYRLIEEFSPRVADLTARHQRIRQVELALHTLPASAPGGERAALESELASGQALFAQDKASYQADAERRSREVLAGVLKDASLVYRQIGVQRGLARLYQDGLAEPVFTLAPEGADAAPGAQACGNGPQVDLTDDVVEAFDNGP